MRSNQQIGKFYIQQEYSILFVFRDSDIDGTWEAPSIDNPLCKDAPGCGEWTAPMIPNPLYKGPWRAPLVDNPNYSVCHFHLFFISNENFFRVDGNHVKFSILIISKKVIHIN
jgi:hypothetical protein